MEDKKTMSFVIRLSISIIIAFVLVAGGTLAYWQWASIESKNVVFNIVSGFEEYVVFDEGDSHFVGNFQKTDSFCEGVSTTVSVYKTRDDIEFEMTINMDINSIGDSIASTKDIYWVVSEGNNDITCSNGIGGLNSSSVISYGTFYGKTAPSTFTLTEPIIITGNKKEYTVWIWLYDDSELTSGETVNTNIWSQIDMLDFDENRIGDAYAVYSDDDNSLRFYRSETPIKVGSTYNGLTVTNVYTGFEDSTATLPPWNDKKSVIRSIVFEDYIYPVSTQSWFGGSIPITNIDLSKLDTSDVTNMTFMFSGTFAYLDVSNFNTSKVTTMNGMFFGAIVTDIVGIENWDTSNVVDMMVMFYRSRLENLDLSDWNVCKVTSYGGFNDSAEGTIIKPNFGNTARCNGKTNVGKENAVGDAYAVYSEDDDSLRFYRSTTAITAGSTFDGRTVTNVYTGFESASYTSNSSVPWNGIRTTVTSVVFEDWIYPVSTAYWFVGNNPTVDLIKLDTSYVTNMSWMFANFFGTIIGIEDLNTSNVTNFIAMFMSFGGKELNLSKWNTSNATNMSSMFDGSLDLGVLNVTGWDTSNVTSMNGTFSKVGASNGVYIYGVEDWDTSNVTDMSNMFSVVRLNKSINLSGWKVCNVSSYNSFLDSSSGTIVQPYFGDTSKCNGGLPA